MGWSRFTDVAANALVDMTGIGELEIPKESSGGFTRD